MTRKDKLIERISSNPKDFTWNELKTLMNSFGYSLIEGSGSRCRFINKHTGDKLFVHKPHPGNTIKTYLIKDIYNHLIDRGLIVEDE